MEFVIFYNTERFNIDDVSEDPIIRNSVVKTFDFNPTKKYVLNSSVTRGRVVEERQLFSRSSRDFFRFEAGELYESINNT